GFSLCTDELSYLFKPVSVQAMWSAIQSLYKALRIAEDMNYIADGLTHTWVGYYKSRIDIRDLSRVCQWSVEGVEIFAPSSLSVKANDCERERVKLTISNTLKEVMLDFDLDEVTSLMLRKAVEQKMGMSLAEYKSYFDEEVMRIVGQMDKPSEILEFLYLGSEWNASNLDELVEKGIGYILNVTKEIDNFFEGKFQYYNVRVYDVDESDLLKHWDKTYKFISKARSHNSKVLVHCKMGVSRSASTVMAFIMKDQRLTVNEAFQFVKDRRGCVHPNSGFMEQLRTYEGILSASNKRDIFRCKSKQNLTDDGSRDEAEPSQGDFLGDSLFRMMSHPDWQSASGNLEAAESRSADSTEESTSDLLTSAAESAALSCLSPAPAMAKTAPMSIVRPSVAAADKEMSQERGASSEAESLTALSSSEGSISLQLRSSSSALASRIKPDCSWIKFDLVQAEQCDTCGETLPFVDALSCDDLSSSTPPSHLCASCIAKLSEAASQLAETHFLPGTSGESKAAPATTSLPYLPFSSSHLVSLSPEKTTPAAHSSDVHFYIGNIHSLLDMKHTTGTDMKKPGTVNSNIDLSSKKHSHVTLPSDSVTSLDNHITAVKLSQLEESASHTVANKHLEESAEISRQTLDSSSKTEETEAALQGLELGVRQYFIPEKIPWKPGKVRKMQEDINKTGQISQDQDIEQEEKGKTFKDVPEMKETHDDCSLLEHTSEPRPATSLCQSLSCVELSGSQECDQAQLSVYQREEIPLIPGTVSRLRTWLEVEERQGLCGEGDQEVAQTPCLVDRSFSLKLQRGLPHCRYTDNRRFTTGHIIYPDKCLLDLQSPDDDLANSRPTVPESSGHIEDTSEDIDISSSNFSLAGIVSSGNFSLAGIVSSPVIFPLLEHRCETDIVQPKAVIKSASSSSVRSAGASFSLMPSSSPSSVLTSCATVGKENAENRHSDSQPSCTSGARDSFDSDSLVQEMASSLLVSSSPSQFDDSDMQSCANMVKYFVRKIEKQGVDSPQIENQGVDSPQIENQGVDSPQIEMQVVASAENEAEKIVSPMKDEAEKIVSPMKDEAEKIVSPMKDEAFQVKFLSETETASCNRALLVSLNAAVLAKSRKPSEVTGSTSADVANLLTHVQSEVSVQLKQSQENIVKTSDPSGSGSSRQNLFLKLDSSACLPQQVSSPMLEDVGKISLSSPVNESQEQISVKPEMRQPDSSTSPRSPGHSLVQESLELSVVRHLVGRFENRSPEPDRVSSDTSHDLILKPKDCKNISVSSQSASSRSHREQNLIHSYLEDTARQSVVSSFLSSYRSVDSCPALQLSSSAASTDLLATSPPSRLLASPRLPLHKKHMSLDSASCSADVVMTNALTCDIPVELHELSTGSSNVKDMSADFSSKRLGPIPFNRRSLESTERKTWRSVRPTSVELFPHSASDLGHASVSSDTLQRSKQRSSYSSFPAGDDDVSLRQVSDQGRKIRRLQGKSHPLTKLSEPSFGKGPFYSSM
ncbi:unnamed protein product, partial [Candidula unifasciata]